ncbi:MAG: hypothetical protein AB7H97_09960, partial [Pseudobdellovibrionaceae bacterium]
MFRKFAQLISVLGLMFIGNFALAEEDEKISDRGADGIEMQPIPIDTRVNCSAVILKGTRTNRGTAFVLPRMLVSIDKSKEQLFEIVHLGDGKYQLVFSVFFPRTDVELNMREETNHFTHGCNYDEVVASLNKNISDESQKIKTVARVPIKYIKISVPGIEGLDGNYTIGSKQTTMLNYQGVDLMITLPIRDRATVDRILARLREGTGLEVRAELAFNARTGDGGTYATIKLAQVAKGLESALKGQVWVAQADLKATLSDVVSNLELEVETYAGSSSIQKEITEKLMAAITSRINPTRPTATPPPARDSDDKNKEGKEGQPSYELKAIVNYLREQNTLNIAYSNFTANREEIYSTSVIVRADLDDPEMKTLKIINGEEALYPSPVKKGEELLIVPMRIRKEKLSYETPVKRYFTTTQIKQFELASMFTELNSPGYVIEDAELANYGIIAQVFVKPLWGRRYVHPAGYRWGSVEFPAKAVDSEELEIDWIDDVISAMPLRIQFSKIGSRKFTVPDILAGNLYFSAEVDYIGGKIKLIAKKDLGRATFYWDPVRAFETRVSQYFFEEKVPSGRKVTVTTKNEVKKSVPTTRSTLVF